MSGPEILRIALAGVGANKLRSGLTILGMTIGVAAVIILVAVGNGSKLAVQERINALGSNVLLVQPQGGRFGPGGAAGGVSFTTKDADALADTFNAPDVARVSPVVNASGTTFTAGSTSYEPSSVTGTVPAYAKTRDFEIASGAMFTSDDVKRHHRVVVLGPTVVANLFAGADPVGSSVRINGTQFQVVGRDEVQGLQRRPGPGRRRARAADRGPGRDHGLRERVELDHRRGLKRRRAGRRAGRGHVDPDRAQERQRPHEPGLSGDQPGRGARGERRLDRRLHHAARRGRRDLAARRRDRRDEHHARLGHRAHARDRHPQGDRRAARGHPRPVPDRGGAGERPRRRHRRASSGSSAASSRSPASSPRSPSTRSSWPSAPRCWPACSSAPTQRAAPRACARSTP